MWFCISSSFCSVGLKACAAFGGGDCSGSLKTANFSCCDPGAVWCNICLWQRVAEFRSNPEEQLLSCTVAVGPNLAVQAFATILIARSLTI